MGIAAEGKDGLRSVSGDKMVGCQKRVEVVVCIMKRSDDLVRHQSGVAGWDWQSDVRQSLYEQVDDKVSASSVLYQGTLGQHSSHENTLRLWPGSRSI